MTLQELFTDETTWCKESACNRNGKKVFTYSDADSFCLLGGCEYVYGIDKYQAIEALIKQELGVESLIQWNDKIAKFSDIRRVIEKLNI